ncbi:FecR domain-containing protein [Candidatus Sumerlaeota bacterium]|nr:FecR domain-containing protein [Candidatus Sumerlaeota bacterium]
MNPYFRIFLLFLTFSLLFLMAGYIDADEIVLSGGKVITGKIISDTQDLIKLETEQYGEVAFPKNIVEKITYTDKGITIIITPVASPSPPSPSPVQTNVASPGEKVDIIRPSAPTEEIQTGYDAVIFGVMQEVFIKPFGGDWIQAAPNMQLKVMDEARTGLGKAKMKLRGRGEVRLPPNSHMILVSMDPEGNQVTIELKSGRIWNNITPSGGVVNYTIKTPDLVAGVRGTLFKVSLDEAPGSRLAVFEGSVYAADPTGKFEASVAANFAIATDKQGRITQPFSVHPDEIKEWTEWDQWALDVHRNISSRFIIGGEQIDQMAKLAAEDGKRYEQIVSEANQQILYNREAERIEGYKSAFMQFARDTSVFPTDQMGFAVLIENPGLPGWKKSYIEDKTLPILDRWGQPLKYTLKKSPNSGNMFGEIHSSGPNRIYEEGKSGTDDIRVIIPYYQIDIPK